MHFLSCPGQFCDDILVSKPLDDAVIDVNISGVAQWLACWAHNPKVRGSKPRSATFLPRRSRWDCSLTTTIPFLNQSGNHSSAHSCKFSAIHHHAHVYLPSMAACQSRCRIVVSTCMASCQIRCSIVVSISACHAEDPGSIPGGGAFAVVCRQHWT